MPLALIELDVMSISVKVLPLDVSYFCLTINLLCARPPAVYSELHPARVWPRHPPAAASLWYSVIGFVSSRHNLPDYKDVSLFIDEMLLCLQCTCTHILGPPLLTTNYWLLINDLSPNM